MQLPVILQAADFEDRDDCLQAAVENVATERGLDASTLEAFWGNADGELDHADVSRETIIVMVPA